MTITPVDIEKLAPALLCLALGCTGRIGGILTDDGSGARLPPSPTGTDSKNANRAALPAFSPAAGGLRRLTSLQYRNTIRDLLGEVVAPQDIEPDVGNFGLVSLGVARAPISTHGVEQFDGVAVQLARKVMTDPTRRAALLGCTPTASDPTCALDFAQRFGRRAFRRPLTGDEVAMYKGLFTSAATSAGDPFIGIEMVLVSMLESPKLLYRSELGAPDASATPRRSYTGFEMATRLSYLVWNTTPDDALLDAAAVGRLSEAEGIKQTVSSMLTSAHARAGLSNFFAELLNLDRVLGMHKDATRFPQMSAALATSMQAETLALFEDVVFGQNADYRSLLESDATWVDGGPRELAHAIRQHDDVARCAVDMLYQYAAGHVTEDGERIILSDLVGSFTSSGGRLQDLMVSIALSDGFRYVGPPR